MEQYKVTYERNRESLQEYQWWRYGELPIYERLPNAARQINTEDYTPTDINTRPFFRDLSKPLLVKNERNSYHFGYLVDNVRASEDFGGDNHIYMYYDSKEEFYRLLQAVDITPYLSGKKIVFLLGVEELTRNYPLDFKKEYGIDYEAMGEKPLRVEEIQRLVMHWLNNGYSGNVLWSGILDWHKNLLTIKDFGLVGIHYIYKKLLKGHTVEDVYNLLMDNESMFIRTEFDALFSPWHESGKTAVPNLKIFFLELEKLFPSNYRPNEAEWLKGMFLAYGVAMGRKLNSRIAPAIAIDSHFRGPTVNMNNNLGWIRAFKYYRCISILRRYTTVVASCMETEVARVIKGKYTMPLLAVAGIFSMQWQKKRIGESYSMPIYADEESFYLSKTRMVRFEDLKLEPKATLEAVLDFFDLEWDDNLMHTTANGQSEVWYGSENPVQDFDPAPVLRKREKMLSPFDYYRMELMMGDFLVPWGYKPQYYKDEKKYSPEEILKLFNKPFKCEEFCYTCMQRQSLEEAKQKLYKTVRDRLKRTPTITPDGRKLVPIPWLKPKAEFMQGKLYE